MKSVVANARAAWTTRSRALVVRFQRMTPRERLLVAALAMGVVVYAPVFAMDQKAAASDRYIDAVTERAAARLALSAARRAAADPVDRAVFEDMRSWGIGASNAATAQVLLERRLFEAATQAELPNFRITTQPELEEVGATRWVGGEVQADLRWTPTFAFLDLLAAWPEGFRVTSFRYEQEPAPAVVEPPRRSGRRGSRAAEPPPVVYPAGTVRIGVAVPVRLSQPEGGQG